jgi:peroxiredoxin
MIRFAAAAAFVLGLGAMPAPASPIVGEPAPAFTAVDSNGRSHALGDFKGKTVVLEWTNDGCPYVRKHYGTGSMQKTQRDLTAAGAVWLTIVSSAPGKQGYVDGRGANDLTTSRNAHPTAVLLDPKGVIGRAYEAQTTPHMFVIDKTGVLRYMGAIDDQPTVDPTHIADARNYVREAFAAVSAGKSVAETATDPYGCSVKY